MAALTTGTAALRIAFEYRAYFSGIDLAVVSAKVNAELAAAPVNGRARLACDLQPNPNVMQFWIDRWIVRNQWHILVLSFLHIDRGIEQDLLRQAFNRAMVKAGMPSSAWIVEFGVTGMTAAQATHQPPPPGLAVTGIPGRFVLWRNTPGPGERGFVQPPSCPQRATGGGPGGVAGGGAGASGGGAGGAAGGGAVVGPIGARMPTAVTGEPMTGTQFLASIQRMSEGDREQAIYDAVIAGNIPAFLRNLVPIAVSYGGHTATFRIMPDFLAVGTDADYFYVPLKPKTAQRIANAWSMLLPTPKMVGDAFNNAAIKLVPRPMSPTAGESRASTRLYTESNRVIHEAKGTRSGLTTGGKKHVVIASGLTAHPGRVLIFGWYYPTLAQAKAGMGADHSTIYIQGYSYTHDDSYEDYSHGIQLVDTKMIVDGVERPTEEVLKDSALHRLLSNESAPLRAVRYPTA